MISSHNFASWTFYCFFLLPSLLLQMNSINSVTKTWDEFLVLSNVTGSETTVLIIHHPDICNVLSRALFLMSFAFMCLIIFSYFLDIFTRLRKNISFWTLHISCCVVTVKCWFWLRVRLRYFVIVVFICKSIYFSNYNYNVIKRKGFIGMFSVS